MVYSKTCAKRPLSKRLKIGFQDQLSLNAGQKYCRMLPLEHSAILSTFNKLPFVIKTLFCLFLSGHFTQVLMYCECLHVLLYIHWLPYAQLVHLETMSNVAAASSHSISIGFFNEKMAHITYT